MIRDHIFCEADAPYHEKTHYCVNCNNEKYVACPYCDGSGRVDGEVCLECEGTLKVQCPDCKNYYF